MIIEKLIHSVHSPKITFKLPLTHSQSVYVSISKTNYCNDERCVVLVDSKKFLQLWRNEPFSIHNEERMGNKKTWVKDRKYPAAHVHFAQGEANPVPLAQVVCDIHIETKLIYKRKWLLFKELTGVDHTPIPYLAFDDGITRTIWLLANECPYFPVECRISGALTLAKHAGVSSDSFVTVKDLFSAVSHLNVPAHERDHIIPTL